MKCVWGGGGRERRYLGVFARHVEEARTGRHEEHTDSLHDGRHGAQREHVAPTNTHCIKKVTAEQEFPRALLLSTSQPKEDLFNKHLRKDACQQPGFRFKMQHLSHNRNKIGLIELQNFDMVTQPYPLVWPQPLFCTETKNRCVRHAKVWFPYFERARPKRSGIVNINPPAV